MKISRVILIIATNQDIIHQQMASIGTDCHNILAHHLADFGNRACLDLFFTFVIIAEFVMIWFKVGSFYIFDGLEHRAGV